MARPASSPPGATPCPIQVKLTGGEAGGVTSFGFSRGRVSDQDMTVEGRLDRILASALPHEVTHTIFAAYFGGPMPRWADEGASLLSEDLRERQRHDQIAVDLLARRGDFPLARLFRIEEYPTDLMGFYGQGYSISRFLIEMGGRPRFLKFVKDGLAFGLGRRHPHPLRPGRRPRARPRLALVAQSGQPGNREQRPDARPAPVRFRTARVNASQERHRSRPGLEKVSHSGLESWEGGDPHPFGLARSRGANRSAGRLGFVTQ